MDYKILGELLKQRRKEKNLTLKDMEKQIGISNGYLSLVERGKKDLRIDTLEKIIAPLELDIYAFFAEVGNVEKEMAEKKSRKNFAHAVNILEIEELFQEINKINIDKEAPVNNFLKKIKEKLERIFPEYLRENWRRDYIRKHIKTFEHPECPDAVTPEV